MEIITGKVKSLLFEGKDKKGNFTYFLRVESDELEKNDIVKLFNQKEKINKGSSYEFHGDFKEEEYQGKKQKNFFSNISILKEDLETKGSFVDLIKEDKTNFKGLGEKVAEKIYEKFGKDVWDELDRDPQQFLSVITPKQLKTLKNGYNETRGKIKYAGFLREYFSASETAKIINNEYFGGERAINNFKKNPFIFTKIRGIGFKSCDKAYIKYIQKNIVTNIEDENLRQLFLLGKITFDGILIKKPELFIPYKEALYNNKRLSYGIDYLLNNHVVESGNTLVLDKGRYGLISIMWNELGYKNIILDYLNIKYNLNGKSYSEIQKVVENKYSGEFRKERDNHKNKVTSILKIMEQEGEIMTVFKDIWKDGKKQTIKHFQSKQRFTIENTISERIKMLSSLDNNIDVDKLNGIINKLEQKEGIKLSKYQREAVYKAHKKKFLVLIGAAGTGKTTTSRFIIRSLREMRGEETKINAVALSAKAAEVLRKNSGLDAFTIHRTLGALPEGGFKVNKNNPLETDLFIVDEASMVNDELFYHIINALPVTANIILIGDPNQLESIGSGKVLSDIVDSDIGKDLTIKLTKIFRQSDNKKIIKIAHQIIHYDWMKKKIEQGKYKDTWESGDVADYLDDNGVKDRDLIKDINGDNVILRNGIQKPLSTIKRPTDTNLLIPSPFEYKTWDMGYDVMLIENQQLKVRNIDVNNFVVDLITNYIPKYAQKYDVSPEKLDYKILTPQKTVVHDLNFLIQKKVNKSKNFKQLMMLDGDKRLNYTFKEGDECMHIKNNMDLGLFNGDVGNITQITDENIICEYNEEHYVYTPDLFYELRLAYCMTVHKSQGSEYQVVIIVLPDNMFYKLMSRNLLYTALTRAKNLCIFIGERHTLLNALENNNLKKKKTGLIEKLNS